MPVPGGDGIPDIDPNTGFTRREQVARRDLTSDFKTYFFTAKLTGAISSNHQWQITGFGNPKRADAVFATVRDPNTAKARSETGRVRRLGQVDLEVQRGQDPGGRRRRVPQRPHRGEAAECCVRRTRCSLRAMYGRSMTSRISRARASKAATTVRRMTRTRRSRTARSQDYTERGLGFLEDRTNNRTSAVLSLTQRVKAAGQHVFKVGLDTEFSSYDSGRRFSGGVFLVRDADDLSDPNMPLGGHFQITPVPQVRPVRQHPPAASMPMVMAWATRRAR